MDVRWQGRVITQHLVARKVAILVATSGVKMRAQDETHE
jgi:hypothetical protein